MISNKTIIQNTKDFIKWSERKDINDKIFVLFVLCIILTLIAVWTGVLK